MYKHHSRDTMTTQEYQIIETPVGQKLANACAQFKYKGFTISFSTHNYGCGGCANEVLLMPSVSHMVIGDQPFHTVQEAIEWVEDYHKEQVKLDSF